MPNFYNVTHCQPVCLLKSDIRGAKSEFDPNFKYKEDEDKEQGLRAPNLINQLLLLPHSPLFLYNCLSLRQEGSNFERKGLIDNIYVIYRSVPFHPPLKIKYQFAVREE